MTVATDTYHKKTQTKDYQKIFADVNDTTCIGDTAEEFGDANRGLPNLC
jgi:hypothetical protein